VRVRQVTIALLARPPKYLVPREATAPPSLATQQSALLVTPAVLVLLLRQRVSLVHTVRLELLPRCLALLVARVARLSDCQHYVLWGLTVLEALRRQSHALPIRTVLRVRPL
jgi:hypothetical protein